MSPASWIGTTSLVLQIVEHMKLYLVHNSQARHVVSPVEQPGNKESRHQPAEELHEFVAVNREVPEDLPFLVLLVLSPL